MGRHSLDPGSEDEGDWIMPNNNPRNRKSAADRLKKAGQKSMASRTKKVTGKSAADMAKDRKRQVVAKKAGPTKRRVAGEPPNRSMSVKARSVRAGRVRDRKVGQMNSNIKKMQGPRPY